MSEAPPGLRPDAGAIAHGIANAVDFPPWTVPAEFIEAPAGRGAFLLLPAMGTPARYYRPFAEACAAVGFHVFLPELPGTGSSTPRPSRAFDYGYRELVDAWAVPLVKTVYSALSDFFDFFSRRRPTEGSSVVSVDLLDNDRQRRRPVQEHRCGLNRSDREGALGSRRAERLGRLAR